MKTPELLAPVGSFESLHAAIRAGADAIYFGVEQLNMRTKSVPTITIEDIAEIVEVCHDNGIKCYLTLNTVMYDHDMQLAARIIKACKTQGVDAIIASDFFCICVALCSIALFLKIKKDKIAEPKILRIQMSINPKKILFRRLYPR